MADGPGIHPATSSRRIVRKSALWFSEGSHRKAEARRAHRCVECGAPLPSGRTPYCGRVCQWRFQGEYFWDAARTYVLHRDRFTCRACGRRHRVRDLEVDHIQEIALGGRSLDYGNLQTLCRPCHRAKTVRFLRGRARLSPSAGGLEAETPASAGLSAPDGPEWFPA